MLQKLKYPLMDLYRIQQREHVSNIIVAKYADKSQAVSVIDNFFTHQHYYGQNFHHSLFSHLIM